MARLLIYALAASMCLAVQSSHCNLSEEGSCKMGEDDIYVYVCGSGRWQEMIRGQWECRDGKWQLPYRSSTTQDINPVPYENTTNSDTFTSLNEPISHPLVASSSHSHGDHKSKPATNNEQFKGELTYYATGMGACGEINSDGDNITAVSHILYDAEMTPDPNNNPICGRMIRAQRYNEITGQVQSLNLRVVDRCTGCAQYDLDVTETTFGIFAPINSGRVDIEWSWQD